MSDYSFDKPSVFPASTDVGAYPVSAWPGHVQHPSGAPIGSATDSDTVASDGTFDLSLADGDYWLVGEVDTDVYRYVRFSAGQDTPGYATPITEVDGLQEALDAKQTASVIQVDPLFGGDAETGAWTNAIAAAAGGLYRLSSGAQNDQISWNLPLVAGTWALDLCYFKSSNLGIATVSVDGASEGTIDQYAASAAYAQKATVGDIVIPEAGVYTVALKAATKHASASSYYLVVQRLRLRLT